MAIVTVGIDLANPRRLAAVATKLVAISPIDTRATATSRLQLFGSLRDHDLTLFVGIAGRGWLKVTAPNRAEANRTTRYRRLLRPRSTAREGSPPS